MRNFTFFLQRWDPASLHFLPFVSFLCFVNCFNHVCLADLHHFGVELDCFCSYIIGIYDVDTVQGQFNLFQNSQFSDTAISFPVISFISGIILFLVGSTPLCSPSSANVSRCSTFSSFCRHPVYSRLGAYLSQKRPIRSSRRKIFAEYYSFARATVFRARNLTHFSRGVSKGPGER